MKSFEYTIKDPYGIHARPAGILVKEARKFKSHEEICVEGKRADLSKLIPLMGLCVKQGMKVTVSAEGEDEDEAIAAFEKIFNENL